MPTAHNLPQPAHPMLLSSTTGRWTELRMGRSAHCELCGTYPGGNVSRDGLSTCYEHARVDVEKADAGLIRPPLYSHSTGEPLAVHPGTALNYLVLASEEDAAAYLARLRERFAEEAVSGRPPFPTSDEPEG